MSAPRSRTPRRTRAVAGVTTLLSVVLLMAACGGTDGGGGTSAAPDPPELAGKTFVSTEVTGHELVQGTVVSLAFLASSISANAGCNTMNGGATWTGGVLTVPGDALASTRKLCPEPLTQQDTWLSSFLTSGPALTLDGTQLVLTKDDVSVTFEEEQPLPLDGTTWKLTGTIANQGVSTVPAGVESSIVIPAGGSRMEIKTGCNFGAAPFTAGADNTATEGTLTIMPWPMTLMACAGDATTVEQHVTAVLDGSVEYTIDGDTLTLTNGDTGLVYTGS